MLPVVASIFTSLGFKTFLPNGISVGPGYPLITYLNSANTGKLVSFSEKNKSQNTHAVLVLSKPKLKGDRIEEADLILAHKNNLLSRGAFEDLKLVLGKRLKKSLQKGSILKAIHLNPDWLVHKNQRIMIENNNGEIYVAMEGIALSNGAKGDRILAKNISSNKTVEGFVKSEKKISIFRKIY